MIHTDGKPTIAMRTQVATHCFNCKIVIPRLHEEIADLRRELGVYEDALEEIGALDWDGANIGTAIDTAMAALNTGAIDVTPADTYDNFESNRDPGDESDA